MQVLISVTFSLIFVQAKNDVYAWVICRFFSNFAFPK